ncbi:S8 family serine peptidase [Aestuariivirga sp.]|jgi:Ca2+-binding RTX toxin-like protein/subtilisin-like proprotein convertase family protein|uniref:S8 family serine peptidase n=1 Tax=Aestuariivirga sp. TaxID=2650926 RepID=UPI003783FA2C
MGVFETLFRDLGMGNLPIPASRAGWLTGSSFSAFAGIVSPWKKAADGASASSADEFAIQSALVPSDPLFSQQWHFAGNARVDINITEAWDYYSGAGIRFGVYDDGIDDNHSDLAANYDPSLHVTVNGYFDDPTVYNSGDAHGTAVAGLIAARQGNSAGGVGGSFNGRITGVDIFGPGDNNYFFGVMSEQDRFDITNHSWGFVNAFQDNRLNSGWSSFFAGLQDAAANGRDGLGTIQMVAAGNSRTSSLNTNTSGFTSSRFVNAIAAIGNDGEVSYYSNPGAALLVASPSNGATLGITTTDYTGSAGYSSGDYTSGFGGTSAATPIASSVVGLILEANPTLGYRDVQEILAITARQIGSPEPAGTGLVLRPWQFNGAANWNNGGMHFSHDYGFGLIDAFAAVKLAESWNLQQTYVNELMVSATNAVGGDVPDNDPTGLTRTVDLTPASGAPVTIEAIEVQINWSTTHSYAGDLVIELISPDGTTSYLLDQTGGSADLGSWIFTTRAHLGELATGVWTVRITDKAAFDTGTVSSVTVRAYGSSDVDDNYYFTDEFAALGPADAGRRTLEDTDGGIDTINFAALTGGTSINLNPGQTNLLAGSSFVIAAGTVIENVTGSWSNDTIIGNSANNKILGNHGNDTIQAMAGNDQVWGGEGSDTVDGGGGTDTFYLEAAWSAVQWAVTGLTVTFTYANAALGSDIVSNVEQFIDSLGVQVSWETLSAFLDAPVITGFAGNSGNPSDSVTNDATPTLTITTDVDADSVEVFLGGQSLGFATGANGVFSFTPQTALGNGVHSFTAQATRGTETSAVSTALTVTVDTVAPALASLSPADDATAVNASANIVLTFAEDVVAGTGNIEIRLASDGSLWRSIAVSSSEVSISGAQVTINPAVNLTAGTQFYLAVAPGVLTDVAGNAFGGFAGSTAYNFTTLLSNLIEGNNSANTLSGTNATDTINGLGGNDTISGNGGDDTIDGGADNDTISGNSGDDTIDGGSGDDTLNGGTNIVAGDTVSYASATAGVTVTLASTISQNTAGAGSDTLSGFENLTGSNHNDRLTGSTGANVIKGVSGDDVITGGRGADILWGGEGSDTFDFNAVNESGITTTSRDVIMDFQQGQDRIDLGSIDASSVQSGNNAFLFRGESSAFGTAPNGEIRYMHQDGLTVIYGDTDRDSTPEFQIALNGIYTLTSADFIL